MDSAFSNYSDSDVDHAGLVAWVDDNDRFHAVGADDVAREYGDGDEKRLKRDLNTPRHLQATADGAATCRAATCRADALCRCRTCKPPLSEVRALQRLRIGLVIAALVVAMLIGVTL